MTLPERNAIHAFALDVAATGAIQSLRIAAAGLGAATANWPDARSAIESRW
jgi:hypothetical protein